MMAFVPLMAHLTLKEPEMIREIPVDSDRIELVASGHVVPVPVWAEMPDGSRKLMEDQQAVDEESGELLWNVDVFGESGRAGTERAEVVSVQVRSPYQPTVARFAPISFRELAVRFSKGRDGNLKNYWAAAGVNDPTGQTTGTKPAPSGAPTSGPEKAPATAGASTSGTSGGTKPA